MNYGSENTNANVILFPEEYKKEKTLSFIEITLTNVHQKDRLNVFTIAVFLRCYF